MAKREVVVGDKVVFTDQDGYGDHTARNGDVGIVTETDGDCGGEALLTIKLTSRTGEIHVCAYRVEIVGEVEITLDKAVEECKTIKTEIQRLQLELNKYESILFKAGVKLI